MLDRNNLNFATYERGSSHWRVFKPGGLLPQASVYPAQFQHLRLGNRTSALQPDASVAIIARAHEVNANQLFRWRKLYRQGQLDAKQDSADLVRVRVSDGALGSRK